MSGKCLTLYNSCVRVRMRGTRRKKFYKKQGETAAKPEAANGIRQTERNFYTDEKELFTFPLPETYGSATQNVRFEQRKHIVQRKKLYKRPSHLIKKLFDFSTKPKSFLFKDIIFLGKCVHQSEIFHLSMLFSKSNLQLDQTKMDDQQEVPMANRLKKSYKDFHYSYNN